MRLFNGSRWREGAERFTHFDHSINAVAHLRVPRISQDAPVPQSARAEFHSSAIPGDHLSSRDEISGFGASLLHTPETRDLDALLVFGERLVNVDHRVGRAKKWHRETAIGQLTSLGRAVEGGSQSRAIIPGGGLHVNFVKKAGAQELPIGRAVERDSPSHRQPPQSQLLSEVAAKMHHGSVEASL